MRSKPKAVIKPLPPVFGKAIVEKDGERTTRGFRLFEKLPAWWSKGTEDQRQLWLTEYFRRDMRLAPDELLISAEVKHGV
jgi:hypothetical protein